MKLASRFAGGSASVSDSVALNDAARVSLNLNPKLGTAAVNEATRFSGSPMPSGANPDEYEARRAALGRARDATSLAVNVVTNDSVIANERDSVAINVVRRPAEGRARVRDSVARNVAASGAAGSAKDSVSWALKVARKLSVMLSVRDSVAENVATRADVGSTNVRDSAAAKLANRLSGTPMVSGL